LVAPDAAAHEIVAVPVPGLVVATREPGIVPTAYVVLAKNPVLQVRLRKIVRDVSFFFIFNLKRPK
jgi:hypothetical protein